MSYIRLATKGVAHILEILLDEDLPLLGVYPDQVYSIGHGLLYINEVFGRVPLDQIEKLVHVVLARINGSPYKVYLLGGTHLPLQVLEGEEYGSEGRAELVGYAEGQETYGA